MNLKADKSNIILCVIDETNEEKEMYPVYDSDNMKSLTVHEAYLGFGKFYGWQDLNGTIYKKGEAYAKPALPYDLFGIECGDGWRPLLVPIFEYIEKYNKENPDNPIIIEQIKEKFAQLRIYVSHYTDELDNLIHTAENESLSTCEICGTKEDVGVTISGWYTTCCHKCVHDMAVNNIFKRNYIWKRHSDNNIYVITPDGTETIKPSNKQ